MINTGMKVLDFIFYGIISPCFELLAQGLTMVLITPLVTLGLPIALHISLLAMGTALLALWLRRQLKIEEEVKTFNETFYAKRAKQKNLQCINNKYLRSAMYEASDNDLNHDYNTFLAHYYGRYVLIYLLPVFLVMAWLNTIFSEDILLHDLGRTFALALPIDFHGIQGLSVTAIFLLSYLLTLIGNFFWQRRKNIPSAS